MAIKLEHDGCADWIDFAVCVCVKHAGSCVIYCSVTCYSLFVVAIETGQ